MKNLLKALFVKEEVKEEVPVWTFEKNGSEASRDRYNAIHGIKGGLI